MLHSIKFYFHLRSISDQRGMFTFGILLFQDTDVTESKARELYHDIVVQMWLLYRECRLVHADLSEFNLL